MLDRIGSFAGSSQFTYQVGSMQTQMNQLVAEVSSGQKANPEAALGTSAALLYQLQSQSDQQTALQSSITVASQRLDTAQTALTSLASTVQTITTASQGIGAGDSAGIAPLASQATSTIQQVLALLNTGYLGTGVFGGDSGSSQPMQPADGSGGMSSITQNILSAAVAAKGGPLTASDISSLIDGPNGLSSVFKDTNSDPAKNYSGAIYAGSTNGQPTSVIIGANQTVKYDSSANQPAFRDLMKGLSMLSMLSAPSTQLDSSAQTQLLSQASSVLSKAQNEITNLQGSLGGVQSSLSAASAAQTAAATATQAQIASYVQANTYADSTQLTQLQTQLQATYSLTSQISQLSLVHFMPPA